MLTGLATATYPDGSTPEVEDVARVAANVYIGGSGNHRRWSGSVTDLG